MSAPERVGRYEIVRRLCKSMTEVYLANDLVENRRVVLKLVPIDNDTSNRLVLEAERRRIHKVRFRKPVGISNP